MTQKRTDGSVGDDPDAAETERVKRAKAAARETIGKLIGDDAAVDAGQRDQRAADVHDPRNQQSKEQEWIWRRTSAPA